MVDLVTARFIFSNGKGEKVRFAPMRNDSVFEAMFKKMAEEFIKNDSGLCNYYLVEVVVEDRHFNMNIKKEFKWLRVIDNPNNEVSEFVCWVPALLLGDTVLCCNGAFSLSIIEEGDLVDFDKCPLKEGNFGVNVYNKSIGAQNPM